MSACNQGSATSDLQRLRIASSPSDLSSFQSSSVPRSVTVGKPHMVLQRKSKKCLHIAIAVRCPHNSSERVLVEKCLPKTLWAAGFTYFLSNAPNSSMAPPQSFVWEPLRNSS